MPAYAMSSARTVALDPTSAPVANPSDGKAVIMDPFSGPAGSPLDKDSSNNASTGALSTGIGFGPTYGPGTVGIYDRTIPGSVNNPTDDVIPGVTKPDGTAATDATLLAIGGGRSSITVTGGDYARGVSTVNPWSAQPLMTMGNGQARNGAGATGFGMKWVTAAGAVAPGGAIEAGFNNRSGVALAPGQSEYGVNGTAAVAPTMALEEAKSEEKDEESEVVRKSSPPPKTTKR